MTIRSNHFQISRITGGYTVSRGFCVRPLKSLNILGYRFFQELAARYSDTADGPESPRVLDENFDDSQNFDNIQNPINFEDSKKSEENSVGDSESSSQTDESQTEINQQPQIDNKMPIRQNNYQCFTIPVDKSGKSDFNLFVYVKFSFFMKSYNTCNRSITKKELSFLTKLGIIFFVRQVEGM